MRTGIHSVKRATLDELGFKEQYALGLVPGVEFVEFIGKNPDVDTGTLPETVWTPGGVYSWASAASTLEIISSSADDAAAGTGARMVFVYGLDANWDRVTEALTLNGTSASAATATSFLRVNSVRVVSAGSGGTNAGVLTIRDSSAGPTRASIAIGDARTQMGIFTVPAGYTLLLDGFYVSVRDVSGASSADVDFRTRDHVENPSNPVWMAAWSMSVEKIFDSPFSIPHPIGEKTDVEIRVTDVEASSTVVLWHAHAVLVNNAKFGL